MNQLCMYEYAMEAKISFYQDGGYWYNKALEELDSQIFTGIS